jgi:hypothetical protein
MAALDGFAPAFGISQISLNQFKIFFGIEADQVAFRTCPFSVSDLTCPRL